MTNIDNQTLSTKIYNILYAKSRVDGIRLINEDEWPIDELSNLFSEEMETYKKNLRQVLGTHAHCFGCGAKGYFNCTGLHINEYLAKADLLSPKDLEDDEYYCKKCKCVVNPGQDHNGYYHQEKEDTK